MKTYLLSLPERLVRSTLGLGAGAAREVGEVVLPDAVRNTQLYKNLVDATLRFVIEQVGGVEGVYGNGDVLPDNFSRDAPRATSSKFLASSRFVHHPCGYWPPWPMCAAPAGSSSPKWLTR